MAMTGLGVFSFDTKLKLTSLSTLKDVAAVVLAGGLISFFLDGSGVLPLDFYDLKTHFFIYFSTYFTRIKF